MKKGIKYKFFGVILLMVVMFGLAFSVKYLIVKNQDLLSAVITSVLVDLTNSNRAERNVLPLEVNLTLTAIAQEKANDMAKRSYFSHNTPEGKSPWQWLREGQYNFRYAGENLAVNFADSEDVVQAWLNSEGHRTNLLNDRFTEIGIAIAPGFYKGRESIFVVQFFGYPVSDEVKVPVFIFPY
ncbi:MAG: CAP domain-containing protein [bacterium]|nr:CAP domain-containing protein [bacterium]